MPLNPHNLPARSLRLLSSQPTIANIAAEAFCLYAKMDWTITCPVHLVDEDGFGPSKLTQQIYSLPPLATRELVHMVRIAGLEPV